MKKIRDEEQTFKKFRDSLKKFERIPKNNEQIASLLMYQK